MINTRNSRSLTFSRCTAIARPVSHMVMGWRRCSFRAQVLQARLVAALISDVWVLCVPRESHIPQSPTACLCAQLCRSRSAPATRQAEHKQFSTNRLPSRAGGYSLHGALAEPLRISRAESDPLQESLPFPAASTALPASQGGPRASGNVRPTFLQRKGLITQTRPPRWRCALPPLQGPV